jgi:hypothetical protein
MRHPLASVLLAVALSLFTLGFAQAPTSNWYDGIVDWIVDILPIGPGPYEPGGGSAPDTNIGTLTQSDVAGRDAELSFTGTDDVTPQGSLTFECSLDGGAYSTCTSPKTYSDLSSATHNFSVRAKDGGNQTDATPDTQSFLVKNIVNVTSAPYNATGGDATDDTAAIEQAMNAAGTDTVTYVPSGTYYIFGMQVPSNTELEVQHTATFKASANPGPLIDMRGVANTSFGENMHISGVGGRFLIDIGTENTDGTPMRVRGVKNFSIKHVDIRTNNSQPTAEAPTTRHPGITFIPMDQTQLNGEYEHATNGLIQDAHHDNAAFGWGLAQLSGATNVHFENISSEGGVALRLENFQGSATVIDDVTADDVTCTNGAEAVLMNPHNADNGEVHIENVTANSCFDGIKYAYDQEFPAGNYDSTSSIDNVVVNAGTTAQVRDTEGPFVGSWTIGNSGYCVERETGVPYDIQITNITCNGVPHFNWPP